MANYIIIGGDGKEYGPIPSNDVRQWIAEARLNAQSPAKAESDAEFRPLGKFPEFADVFGSTPGSTSTIPPVQAISGDTGSRALALQKIKVPAIGLKITAIVSLLLSTWSLVQVCFFKSNQSDLDAQLQTQLQQLDNPQMVEFMKKITALMSNTPLNIANALFGMAMAALIFMGASRMQALRGYEFAFTATVISILPCFSPCCGYVFGLIFGIWALILLLKPEIKSQFH